MVYYVKPFLFKLYGLLTITAMHIVSVSLIVLFLVDTALSSITLLRIRHNAANLEGDSTEAITNAVRNALTAQPALVRRILQAFPEASIYNKRVIANMKERRKRLESEIKDAKSRAKTALELKEKAMQDSLSQYSSKIHKL